MSSISHEYSVAIQNDIYILTLDDYTPHGILGGLSMEPDSLSWQYAVDIIYRCLAVGFWKVWNVEWMELHGMQDYSAFCKKLSELNPFELSEEGEKYWLEPFLCCTDSSLSLVKKYDIDMAANNFCAPFIDEVERVFAENNVAWGRGSFFPVKA